MKSGESRVKTRQVPDGRSKVDRDIDRAFLFPSFEL